MTVALAYVVFRGQHCSQLHSYCWVRLTLFFIVLYGSPSVLFPSGDVVREYF